MPVVETATGTAGTDSTPDVNLGSPANGELMFCLIIAEDNGGTATTFAPATGWTEIEEITGSGFQHSAAAYYKVAGGSETDPAIFTLNQAVAWMAHVVVVSDHGGYHSADLSALTESGTTVDAPSVTPPAASSLVVSIAASGGFPEGAWTIPSSPGTPTQPTQSGTNGNASHAIASASVVHGNTATGAMTWTSDQTGQFKFAVNFVAAATASGPSIPILTHHIRQQS